MVLSDQLRLAGVASLWFLLVACSGAASSEQLPRVVAPSRPNTLAAAPIPATLDAAIDTFDQGLSANDFQVMQLLREDDAVATVYPVAQWLRRYWLDPRDSGIRDELASVGFDNSADMADAVLTSLWRRLHDRPIALNDQVGRARALRDGTDAGRSVVFSDEAARALIGQCSRLVPMSVTGAWIPDRDVLRHLESELMPALQAALDRATPPAQQAPRATDYYRQYGGLIVGQRRIIYLNGFHRAYLSASRDSFEHATQWRTRAVNVCDGGQGFFGAEYDPSTGRFGSVDFNAP